MPNIPQILTDADMPKFDPKTATLEEEISNSKFDPISAVLEEEKVPKIDSNGRMDLRPQVGDQVRGMKDLVNFSTNGLLKTATGKGFEERLGEKFPGGTSQDSIPQMLGKNAGHALAETVGGALDMATNPMNLMLVGAKPVAGAGKAVGELFTGAKNNIAKEALSPEFAQTKSDFNYDHDARRVMSSMPDVIGPDINSTQAAVENKMGETGQAISDTMQNHPQANTKLDVEDAVAGPFDRKIAELNHQNPQLNSAAIERLQKAKLGLLNEFDAQGRVVSPTNLNNVTPEELWKFRKDKIDPMTKFTGNASDDAVINSAYQDVRGNIKNILNTLMPEVKPLNRDYGDLSAASDAIDRFNFKAQKQGLPSLDLKTIATLGINKFIENPVNRLKLAQWLYTAPKQAIQQASTTIPNFKYAINAVYNNPQVMGGPKTSIPISKGLGYQTKGIPEIPPDEIAPTRAQPIKEEYGGGPIYGENPVKKLPAPSTIYGEGFTASKGEPAKGANLTPNIPSEQPAQRTGPNKALKEAKDQQEALKQARENQGRLSGENIKKGLGIAALGLGAGASQSQAGQNVDMNRIYKIESSNNPKAYNSKTDARGLAQLKASALQDWNNAHPDDTHKVKELFDAETNKKIANWYMTQRIPKMLKHYKIPDNVENRLKAYNFGIGNLHKGKAFPKETLDYIKKYKA